MFLYWFFMLHLLNKTNNMETIFINTIGSRYGQGRNVTLNVFDRLLHENKLYPITSNYGSTTWFFKPLQTILKQQS